MGVWMEKLPEGAKPYEADDRCPYCEGLAIVETMSDSDPDPESAECPHCGKDVDLLIDWEPIVGLVKNNRYEEE